MYKLLFLFLFNILYISSCFAQKVLQLETIGKVATTKIYLGETLFLKTIHHPDYWLQTELEDVLIDAQAIVLADRIIPLKEIVAMKRKKYSSLKKTGRAIQYSVVAPVGYELIQGLVNPPIQWESLAIFSGGTFLLGSLLRLVPPKKYKMGKKYRLRVLDLTF